MSILNYVPYLGLYYGEPELQPLLQEFAFTKAPKLPRGDTTTFLSAKNLGFVLTFRDERTLKMPTRTYPDGALILVNIRFCGKRVRGYRPYAGAIYPGITLDSTKQEVKATLGVPNFPPHSADGRLMPGEDDWKMRWDRGGHAIFFTFTDDGRIVNCSLQRIP